MQLVGSHTTLKQTQIDYAEVHRDEDQTVILRELFEASLGSPHFCKEKRTAAVLQNFPSVPLETLPLNHRIFRICYEDYGVGYDDREACYPLLTPCCPPAEPAVTIGKVCLLDSLVRHGNDKCPNCRGDLRHLIRRAARNL